MGADERVGRRVFKMTNMALFCTIIAKAIKRVSTKPSEALGRMRKKYIDVDPMSMDEIDAEILKYRKENE